MNRLRDFINENDRNNKIINDKMKYIKSIKDNKRKLKSLILLKQIQREKGGTAEKYFVKMS